MSRRPGGGTGAGPVAPRAGLAQRQTQAPILGLRARQSLDLLAMDAADAFALAAEACERNPFLDRMEPGTRARAGAADGDRPEPAAPPPTLAEHLEAQAAACLPCARDRAAAHWLIHMLDADGRLPAPAEAIIAEAAAALAIPQMRAAQVLEVLRGLDPAGVFAVDLAECLRLQCTALDILDAPMRVLIDQLPLVATRQWAELERLTGLGPDALARHVARLRGLSPKPGAGFAPPHRADPPPDLIARLDGAGRWIVEINPDALPRVRHNADLARSALAGARGPAERGFIQAAASEAVFLKDALRRRARTLMRVGQALAVRQSQRLKGDPAALHPLTLADIAETLDMSPSTVSRAVAGKTMLAPCGVVALKALFCQPAVAGDPDAMSGARARAMLARLVASEPGDCPRSDSELARLLAADGLKLARRTIAKYRDILRIPPAHLRAAHGPTGRMRA